MNSNRSKLAYLITMMKSSCVTMGMKLTKRKNFRAIVTISNLIQATLKCATYCINPATTRWEICCVNKCSPYSKVSTRHLYLTEKIKLNLNEGCLTGEIITPVECQLVRAAGLLSGWGTWSLEFAIEGPRAICCPIAPSGWCLWWVNRVVDSAVVSN